MPHGVDCRDTINGMCRSIIHGGRRCRHNPLTAARDQSYDRLRYHRSRLIASVEYGDLFSAQQHADRVADEAQFSPAVDANRAGPLGQVNLRRLSMDRLIQLATAGEVQRDDQALDLVLAEIDRRDEAWTTGSRAAAAIAATSAFHGFSSAKVKVRMAHRAAAWSDSCRALDSMLGIPVKGPVRRKIETLFGVVARSSQGSSEDRMRRDWRAWTYSQYLAAEDYCRGQMLSRRAGAAGADPQDLFRRSAQWIRANASEEFIEWQRENPRMTFAQYAQHADESGSGRWADEARRAEASARELDIA